MGQSQVHFQLILLEGISRKKGECSVSTFVERLDRKQHESLFSRRRKPLEDVGKLILRLTTAGLILFHGIAKLIHGVSRIGDMLAAAHVPSFVAHFVYLGEVAAPLFIIVGLWTRVASLVVVVNMIVAIALIAYRNTFVIQQTGAWALESEAFYLLTAAVIFFMGAGRYSVTKGKGLLG
jgi:putative oxidoreductase